MSNVLNAFKKKEIKRLIIEYAQNLNQLRSQLKRTITTIVRNGTLTNTAKQQLIQRAKQVFTNNQSILIRTINEKIKFIRGLTRIPIPAPTPAPIPAPTPAPVVKKALLIGINYTGTSNQLNGCINDVNDVGDFLRDKGFTINVITDFTSQKPDRSTILAEFKNLLEQSRPGDVLYFMYSGHGSTQRDTNSDEVSGTDQTIIPLDLTSIADDDLKSIIAQYLPGGVSLIALFDSCYSGSVLDLKYQYLDSLNYDNATINDKVNQTTGNVFMISGSTDKQTSEDAYINNRFNGALTRSYLNVLQSNSTTNITWRNLVKMIRDTLKSNDYSQIPQFSCGQSTNIDETIRW